MSLEDDIVKLKLPPPNYKKTPITLRSLMTPRQQIELDDYQTSKRIKELIRIKELVRIKELKEELEERKKRIKERESKRMKSDRERMNRENRESKDIGAIRANRSKE